MPYAIISLALELTFRLFFIKDACPGMNSFYRFVRQLFYVRE